MQTSNDVPLYLEAKSKKELIRLMFLNNVRHGCFFKYFDIQKDGANWVAWYYTKVEKIGVLNGGE